MQQSIIWARCKVGEVGSNWSMIGTEAYPPLPAPVGQPVAPLPSLTCLVRVSCSCSLNASCALAARLPCSWATSKLGGAWGGEPESAAAAADYRSDQRGHSQPGGV